MGIFNIEPLKEVYFGKNKNILEMEKCISEIRKGINRISYGDVYINPSLVKLNRLIEEEFGFKNVSVMIESAHYYNAYTYPVSNAIDTGNEWDKFYIKSNSGYRWKKEAQFSTIIVLFTGILGDPKFTDGEVTAIMLHEIGHSFSNAMNDINIGFSFIKKILFIPSYILTIILTIYKNPGELPALIINSLFLFNKFVGNLARTVSGFTERGSKGFLFYSKIRNLFSIFYIPANEFFYLLSRYFITINIFGLLNTNMEKTSDNFAAMYGYGPELSSALRKMERNNYGYITPQIIQHIPLIGHSFKLIEIIKNIFEEPFSTHPTSISRAKSQLKYLRNEIDTNKQLDKKMKKEIESQINECEIIIDEYIDARNEIKFYNPLILNILFDRIKLSLFDGDIKNLIFSDEENFRSYVRMQDKVSNYKE